MDVVISIYQEELTWLRKRNFSNEIIYAYKKFERFDYDFTELLENVGRESHTFIHHIIKNYNKPINDYTMFLQGDPYPHLKTNQDDPGFLLFENKIKPVHLFYPLGNLRVANGLGRPFSHWDCQLYTIWDELFEVEMPAEFIAIYGAQQVVHKDLIQMRSVKFWEKALELHYKMEHTPWAFEILWMYIFDPRFKTRF
jgi:hypothetical protein